VCTEITRVCRKVVQSCRFRFRYSEHERNPKMRFNGVQRVCDCSKLTIEARQTCTSSGDEGTGSRSWGELGASFVGASCGSNRTAWIHAHASSLRAFHSSCTCLLGRARTSVCISFASCWACTESFVIFPAQFLFLLRCHHSHLSLSRGRLEMHAVRTLTCPDPAAWNSAPSAACSARICFLFVRSKPLKQNQTLH
jgi:hypothetical protein